MSENLSKNIKEILGYKYVVPLYQRNFAWGEEEISQFLQDIYESFRQNKEGNYYIGSLVVLERENGDYEVIDGQQRLTAITLIAKILDKKRADAKLFYDSRPEVENFYRSFYHSPKNDIKDIVFDYKISHLVRAVDFIKETKLNLNDDNTTITIETIDKNFSDFFFENVILVFVKLPKDTDVANYFEIMNNRGQQLQKHEILKAKLLDKIKNNGIHENEKQKIYSRIWDACSQMDVHIQKLFKSDDRKILFGDNYDELPNKEKIELLVNNDITDDDDESIIDDDDDKSIIDFPNFLMHVFKLENPNVPLNEKFLLKIYSEIEKDIKSEEARKFISDLLYYRTVFDRYIVKRTIIDENLEDKFKWTLKKPYKNESSLKYKNTFEVAEQDRIIKALSMLQVTFRNRAYKEWLQEVLGWFKEGYDIKNDYDYFINKLDDWILKYYNNFESEIGNTDYYSQGTSTHHFLLNFIDYLFWVESKDDSNKPRFGLFDFDFRYLNSIEHHRPRSRKNNISDTLIDCLGNLCLVSKSSNSRMNNEEPEGKAKVYYNENHPPKRKIMYDMSKGEGKSWGEKEIKQHYEDVVELLKRREKILKNIIK